SSTSGAVGSGSATAKVFIQYPSSLAAPPSVFTLEQVERARRYHRPRYVAMGLGLALDLTALAVLAAFARWTFGPWWLNAAVLAAFAVVATTLVTLPVSYWSSYRREHEWGFSTQSPRSWTMDIFRKVLVGSSISAAGVVALVGLARAFPSW